MGGALTGARTRPSTFRQVDEVFPHWQPDVDGPDLYIHDERPAPGNRPWVALNMVATVDGAVTVDGRSGGLSGPADKAIFFALRSIADVILVGAGTVTAEDYGPPRMSDEVQAARRARGQQPVPPIAVVSGRLSVEPTARLFRDTPVRPIVLTVDTADPERRAALEAVADVQSAGHDRFDVGIALRNLYERGASVVICEGGPTLNGELLEHDLIDELCVTTSPLLTSGSDPRIMRGASPVPPRSVALDRQLVDDDGFVFSRYLVAR